MASDPLVFVIHPAEPLALRAAVAAIAREMERLGVDVSTAADPWATLPGPRVVVCGDRSSVGPEDAVKLRLERGGWLALEREEGKELLPLSIGPLARCATSEPARVLVRGPSPEGSVRLVLKTAAELKRRLAPVRIVAWGPFPGDLGRREVDEVHDELTPEELGQLLAGASAVLDPARERIDLTDLGALALDGGIPLVCHADAAPGGAYGVSEWSGDAFADQVVRALAAPRTTPTPGSVGAALRLRELFPDG